MKSETPHSKPELFIGHSIISSYHWHAFHPHTIQQAHWLTSPYVLGRLVIVVFLLFVTIGLITYFPELVEQLSKDFPSRRNPHPTGNTFRGYLLSILLLIFICAGTTGLLGELFDRKPKKPGFFSSSELDELNASRRNLEKHPNNPAAWNQRGSVLFRVGLHGKAKAAYRKAMRISKRQNNILMQADAYGSLGLIYFRHSNLHRAAKMYEKSLVLHQALNRKEGMASAYANLGIILYTRGYLGRAEDMYKKALQLFKQKGLQQEVLELQKLLQELERMGVDSAQ